MLSKAVIVLSLGLGIGFGCFAQNRRNISNSTKESVAPYMKSFISVTEFFNMLDSVFVKTASKEEKARLLRQIKFMRLDMNELIGYKLQLFNYLRTNRQLYLVDIELNINRDFGRLNERLKNIDTLCRFKYSVLIRGISGQFQSDLHGKERDLDGIMKDVTGKDKFDKKEVIAQEKLTIAVANRCIQDIDQFSAKLK